MRQKKQFIILSMTLLLVSIIYCVTRPRGVNLSQKQYDLIESMNPELLNFSFFQMKHNPELTKRVIARIEAVHDQQEENQTNYLNWLNDIGLSSTSTLKDLHDVTANNLLSNYGIIIDSIEFDEFYNKNLQADGELMHLIDEDETLMLTVFYHDMMEQFHKSKANDLDSLTLLELFVTQEEENFLDISREIIESEINEDLEVIDATTR